MYSSIIYVPTTLRENDFPKWIESQGFECFKLNQKGYQDMAKHLTIDGEYGDYKDILEKVALALEFIGHPDFVLLYNGKAILCEFKSATDALSIEQIKFFDSFYQLPLSIAVATENKLLKYNAIDTIKYGGVDTKDYSHLF